MLCSIYWAFRALLARLKYGTSRMSTSLLFLIRLLDFAKEGGNIGFNAHRTGFYTSGKQPLLSV